MGGSKSEIENCLSTLKQQKERSLRHAYNYTKRTNLHIINLTENHKTGGYTVTHKNLLDVLKEYIDRNGESNEFLEEILNYEPIALKSDEEIGALANLTSHPTASYVTLLLRVEPTEKVKDLMKKVAKLSGEHLSKDNFLWHIKRLIDRRILELEGEQDVKTKKLAKAYVTLSEMGKKLADFIKEPFLDSYGIDEKRVDEIARN